MKVTHEKKTDSAYIYLRDIKPGEAVRQVAIENCTIILDFDKDGKTLGIEFLNATARLPAEVLAQAVAPGKKTCGCSSGLLVGDDGKCNDCRP